MSKTKFIYIAILMMLPFEGISQEMVNDLQNILIRNVTVIDQTGRTDEVVVNLLIKQNKLNLVTKDKVEMKQADITFDAKNGYVLGQLEVGELAGFIILGEDPRTNPEVILDTRSYAVFAIAKGEVVLNTLTRMDREEERPPSGWLSYAPPPISLPISYQNKRRWNVIRTKPFNFVIGGAMVVENTRWLSNDEVNEEQVGELSQFEGGSIRGFRVGMVGTINFMVPWTFVFFTATNAFERGFEQGQLDEFILFDYRLDIPIRKVNLTIGRTRETISLQRLSPMIHLPSQQERSSVADAMLPSRNVGIVLNSSILQGRMTWATGVFNDWYEKDRSFSDNPTVVTGRLTGLAVVSNDESNLLHLGVAGRYSNAAGGIRYKAKTEIFRGPTSVDTELIDDAQSTFHYGLEALYRTGSLTLGSEYIHANVSSSNANNPGFDGYYFVASYVLTGELRPYNKRSGVFRRISPARELNAGGWGSWEVYSRWSNVNLNDQQIEGGRMNTLSLGLNWWPFQVIQFNINYRYSTLDRFDLKGYNHGLVTRMVFVLE
jgi:phosphate-selective porin OprO/OprP